MGNSKYLIGLAILGLVATVSFSGNAVAAEAVSFGAAKAVEALPGLMREATAEGALSYLTKTFGKEAGQAMWIGGAQSFYTTFKAKSGSHDLKQGDIVRLKAMASQWTDQSRPFARATQMLNSGEKVSFQGLTQAPKAVVKAEVASTATVDSASAAEMALSRVNFKSEKAKAWLAKARYSMDPTDITARTNLAQLQLSMEDSYKLCSLNDQPVCKTADEDGLEGFALHTEDGILDLITLDNAVGMLSAQHKNALGHPDAKAIKLGNKAIVWKAGKMQGPVRKCYKEGAYAQGA